MIGHLDGRPLRIAAGVDASGIHFPDLGYARAAAESYAVFPAPARRGRHRARHALSGGAADADGGDRRVLLGR
ncbi:hypothetical protein [Microbacterium lacticum]